MAAQAKLRKSKGWKPANVTVCKPPDLKSCQGLPPNRFAVYNLRAATATGTKLYHLANHAMTNNARSKAASAPEPDDSGLLLSLDAMVAALRNVNVSAKSKETCRTVSAVVWTPSTISAACALPMAIELPSHYPSRGPGAQLDGSPAFVAAPKDLTALDNPVCPARRSDPLLTAIRCALLNDWAGMPIHRGESAAEGGLLSVSVLLTVIATQPQHQKTRKWAQVLTGSGQTNLLAQVANVAGRFAVMRPEGITLVRDFYASVNQG